MSTQGNRTSDPGVEILSAEPRFPSSEVGPYRRADYRRLPEELRCELISGCFYRLPSPRPLHQIVVAVLWRFLDDIALANGGQAIVAPVGITLAKDTVVEPDVVYLSRRLSPAEVHGGLKGIPDLVIEVVSPSTSRRDRVMKRALFAAAGVPEYWIVDPRSHIIETLVRRDGGFTSVLAAGAGGAIRRSARLPEIALDTRQLWRQVDLRLAP